MFASASIFLDFNLPNAATWFYFSLLLAVALFFKFSRLLSFRNWDVLTVFLLVPGLLLLQGSRPSAAPPDKHPAVAVASVVGSAGAHATQPSGLTGLSALARAAAVPPA